MNFNELLLNSISMDNTSAAFRTETRKTGTANNAGISFAEIFVSRMSDTAARSESSRNMPSEIIAAKPVSKDNVTQNEPLYKSYRQLRESAGKTGTAESKASGKADSGKSIHEDDKDLKSGGRERSNDANVIHILSLLFGVDQEKLGKLLTERGISPEELDIDADTAETVSVLSDALGLGPAQEETLEKLFEMIKGALESDMQGEMIPEEMPSDHLAYQAREVSDNTAEASGLKSMISEDPFMEELISAISEKLDAYGEMLVSENEDAKAKITELLMPLIRKSEAARQNVDRTDLTANEAAGPGGLSAGTETEEVQSTELSEDNASENDGQHELQMNDTGAEQAPLAKPVQNSGNVQQNFAAMVSESARIAETVRTAAQRQTPPVRDIISQIVEKAGASITGDKAEMVMELKPESLGRISLKVVTENGIVMAKLVAENRQVQQVLETNLQILKDSLEKQGINVQSLSVSVRQDGQQDDGTRQQYSGPQRISAGRAITEAGRIEAAGTGLTSAAAERNPYLWDNNSTINLTA